MKMDALPEKVMKRFWAKVQKTDDCWLWTATKVRGGYGHYSVNGKPVRATRFLWQSLHGPIPNKLQVCHKCDVPSCVNPSHLFLGTAKENAQDRGQKGRNNPPRGSKMKSSKLTKKDVIDIRNKRNAGTTAAALGREYGISDSYVCHLCKGHSWGWLNDSIYQKGDDQ